MNLRLLPHIVLVILGGSAMALQGQANGQLAGVLGHAFYAAAASFCIGLVCIVLVTCALPAGRRSLGRLLHLARSGQLPWWLFLGGLGGASIVTAQGIAIPVFGVSVFTLCFVSGQLFGALIVDNTELPAGGRKPMTVPRVCGVIIVLLGVGVTSTGALHAGLSWWVPLLPCAAGAFTGLQQAFNGRLAVASGSALAATCVNFCVGSLALLALAAGVFASGQPLEPSPRFPSALWLYSGGVFGVAFILIAAFSVRSLGVLLLSLSTLMGTIVGSLVIDAVIGRAHAFSPTSLTSLALVVTGVVIASMPGPIIGRAKRTVVSENVDS